MRASLWLVTVIYLNMANAASRGHQGKFVVSDCHGNLTKLNCKNRTIICIQEIRYYYKCHFGEATTDNCCQPPQNEYICYWNHQNISGVTGECVDSQSSGGYCSVRDSVGEATGDPTNVCESPYGAEGRSRYFSIHYACISDHPCPKTREEPGTCRDRCGSMYDKKWPCQCNAQCAVHGNCCPDYITQCNGSRKSPSSEVPETITTITAELLGILIGGTIALIGSLIIVVICYRRRRSHRVPSGAPDTPLHNLQSNQQPISYTEVVFTPGQDDVGGDAVSVTYSTVNKNGTRQNNDTNKNQFPCAQTTYDHIPSRSSLDFTDGAHYDHVVRSLDGRGGVPEDLLESDAPSVDGASGYDELNRQGQRPFVEDRTIEDYDSLQRNKTAVVRPLPYDYEYVKVVN